MLGSQETAAFCPGARVEDEGRGQSGMASQNRWPLGWGLQAKRSESTKRWVDVQVEGVTRAQAPRRAFIRFQDYDSLVPGIGHSHQYFHIGPRGILNLSARLRST